MRWLAPAFYSRDAVYTSNGIPYYLKDGSIPADLLHLLPQPSTSAEAVSVVGRDIAGGADLIKLFTGSWVTNQRVLPMPPDLAAAAVQAAHQRGRLVFAHTSSVAGLEVTLSAGVDVIAHALDDTRGLTAEHLQRMKQQNVALIPTLTLFAEPQNAGAIFVKSSTMPLSRGKSCSELMSVTIKCTTRN